VPGSLRLAVVGELRRARRGDGLVPAVVVVLARATVPAVPAVVEERPVLVPARLAAACGRRRAAPCAPR
jgi:hypothetical protein